MSHDDLMARLDAPPAEAWIPEKEGDLILGTVMSLSSYDAGFGVYPIVTLRVASTITNGRRKDHPAGLMMAVHGLGQVLSQKMQEAAMSPGGEVVIRFDGEKVSKGNQTYKAWSIAYDPPAPGAGLIQRLTTAPTGRPAPGPLDDDEEPF